MVASLPNEVSAELDEGNNDNSICACVHPRAAVRGNTHMTSTEGGGYPKSRQMKVGVECFCM